MWDKLDDSIDSGNFSLRGYLLLIWKEFVTHMHCYSFHHTYLQETLWFLPVFLTGFTLFSVLILFPLLINEFSCTVFNSISSNVDEVLLINPSAVFFSGDFNVYHKGWLTHFSGTHKLCYNFFYLKWLYVSVQIPDPDSHSPALLVLFLSSDTSICSTMAFPPLGNSDHVVVTFHQTQNRLPHFIS